jgi:hypothetical protein
MCTALQRKLVLKARVTKLNRKVLPRFSNYRTVDCGQTGCVQIVMCTCLLLAAKFNDMTSSMLSKLLEQMEEDFNIPRKAILSREFATWVALDFDCHVEPADVLSHLLRIFQLKELTPSMYFEGNREAQLYFTHIKPPVQAQNSVHGTEDAEAAWLCASDSNYSLGSLADM